MFLLMAIIAFGGMAINAETMPTPGSGSGETMPTPGSGSGETMPTPGSGWATTKAAGRMFHINLWVKQTV